jgi:hypothetical protein
MTALQAQSVFAEDAGLAFVFFIAFSLMAALGARFALYAYLNRRAIGIESQRRLWSYLTLVGATAGLYGLLGVVEAATAVTQPTAIATPYRDGVLLGFLLLVSLTMRAVWVNASGPAAADGGQAVAQDGYRLVDGGLGAIVVGSVLAAVVLGAGTATTVVEGAGALGVAGYGLVYGRAQLGDATVRGTMVDSLLRHLLPVSTFGVLVLLVDLAIPAGLDVAIVRHVQVVFVIVTATTLMTATIKLRQNVSGL